MKEGRIASDEFLTKQTAEGLRVTLRSMIDITEYLITEFNFPNVLSGIINQDSLEVCLLQGLRFLNTRHISLERESRSIIVYIKNFKP